MFWDFNSLNILIGQNNTWTNILGSYSFFSKTPEDGTLVLKRVVVLIIVMNYILLSVFVDGSISCRNRHGVNNII